MLVFNGEKTLRAAIESILCQSYSSFELIIINDGSQDQSLEVINQFSDKRIKLFTQTNGGLAKALNIGISHSTGDLIARQDQDDISMPNRIEKQVERFGKNPDLVLLGSSGRIKRFGQIENLSEYLVEYRLSLNSMSRRYENTIATNYKNTVVANLQELLLFSEAEAVVFFDLQFLPQNRYRCLVKLHSVYKFVLGFNKIQVKSRVFSWPVHFYDLKAIIRVCFK